jgi:hypothetical protein
MTVPLDEDYSKTFEFFWARICMGCFDFCVAGARQAINDALKNTLVVIVKGWKGGGCDRY